MRTFTDETGTIVASELMPEWRKLNVDDRVQIGEKRLAAQFLETPGDTFNVIWSPPLSAVDVLNDPVPPLGAVSFGAAGFRRIDGAWVAVRLSFPHNYKSERDADNLQR